MAPQRKRAQKALVIELIAQGYSNAAACREAGIAEGTIYKWYHEPEFNEAVKRATDEIVRKHYPRVISRLGKIVDSKKDFAAIQAGQTLLNRLDRIDGADSQINVTIQGAPDIGTPEVTGDENA